LSNNKCETGTDKPYVPPLGVKVIETPKEYDAILFTGSWEGALDVMKFFDSKKLSSNEIFITAYSFDGVFLSIHGKKYGKGIWFLCDDKGNIFAQANEEFRQKYKIVYPPYVSAKLEDFHSTIKCPDKDYGYAPGNNHPNPMSSYTNTGYGYGSFLHEDRFK
jgi:hypothetical protein